MKPILHFLNVPKHLVPVAKGYIAIIIVGLLATFLYDACAATLRAIGDAVTPLIILAISVALNIVGDLFFVVVLKTGVKGAAIATVTAQIIVLLILVVEILRDHGEANVLHKIRLLSRPDIACLKGVFRIGTPTALQGSLYCIISMILTRMVSGFGDGAIAVQRVGGQIESLSWNTADGFGSALNAFMGQNYGAGKKDRIKAGYHISIRLLICWAALITIAFVFFPRQISVLFFHAQSHILQNGNALSVPSPPNLSCIYAKIPRATADSPFSVTDSIKKELG